MINHDRMNNIGHWLAGTGLLAAFVIILLVIYWETWPYNISAYGSANPPTISVFTSEVIQGEVLVYESNFWCELGAFYITSTRAYEGEVIYRTPSVEIIPSKGCGPGKVSIDVPRIKPGRYRLRIDGLIHLNPIRTEILTLYTSYFEIVSR